MMSISMIESLTGAQQDWVTKHIRPAHVLFHANPDFPVAEGGHRRRAEGQVEIRANRPRKRRIGAARKELEFPVHSTPSMPYEAMPML
jgi:hypothetical protein